MKVVNGEIVIRLKDPFAKPRRHIAEPSGRRTICGRSLIDADIIGEGEEIPDSSPMCGQCTRLIAREAEKDHSSDPVWFGRQNRYK